MKSLGKTAMNTITIFSFCRDLLRVSYFRGNLRAWGSIIAYQSNSENRIHSSLMSKEYYPLKSVTLLFLKIHISFCFLICNLIIEFAEYKADLSYLPSRYGLHVLLVHRPNPSHKWLQDWVHDPALYWSLSGKRYQCSANSQQMCQGMLTIKWMLLLINVRNTENKVFSSRRHKHAVILIPSQK